MSLVEIVDNPTNERLIFLAEDHNPTPLSQSYKGALLARTSLEHVNEAIDYLRTDDEEALALAASLMTNGSYSARELSRQEFINRIDQIAFAYYLIGHLSGWDKNRASSKLLRSSMVTAWATGSVFDECGIDVTRSLAVKVKAASSLANRFEADSNEDALKNISLYRGAAAMALISAFTDEVGDAATDWEPFIEWAGSHEDISLIVNTGIERGTVDMADIQKVIINQEPLQPALRKGAL